MICLLWFCLAIRYKDNGIRIIIRLSGNELVFLTLLEWRCLALCVKDNNYLLQFPQGLSPILDHYSVLQGNKCRYYSSVKLICQFSIQWNITEDKLVFFNAQCPPTVLNTDFDLFSPFQISKVEQGPNLTYQWCFI